MKFLTPFLASMILLAGCSGDVGLDQRYGSLSAAETEDPRNPDISLPQVTIPGRKIEKIPLPQESQPGRYLIGTIRERFQKDFTELDILWVMDNSCSMAEERNSVAQNLNAFVANFAPGGIDYQMAVISTHTNDSLFYGEPPVLRSDDPLLKERFAERINMKEECTYNAAGLYSAHLALSEPRRETHNRGFLRETDFLVIIILSDADEDYEQTSAEYYRFFASLKPGAPHKVVIAAVVGDAPSGCKSPTGYAQPGLQYLELVKMTNGFSESICNPNFAEALGRIGKGLAEMINSFSLRLRPERGFDIEVRVNGELIERHSVRGWIYNEPLNVIQFAGSYRPRVGEVIEVTYKAHVEEI